MTNPAVKLGPTGYEYDPPTALMCGNCGSTVMIVGVWEDEAGADHIVGFECAECGTVNPTREPIPIAHGLDADDEPVSAAPADPKELN